MEHQTKKLNISRSIPQGQALVEWWQSLESDRGGRAALRRAESPLAIAFCPAYQRLYRRLLWAGMPELSDFSKERLAAVCGLLAHVREDYFDKQEGDTTATAGRSNEDALPHLVSMMNASHPDERNPVSELRFRRLLESPDTQSLFSGLRRALPLMGSRVDIIALANDVLYWGDRVKKKWAYNYRWAE